MDGGIHDAVDIITGAEVLGEAEFMLEGVDEAFRLGVVVGIALSTHGAGEPIAA